jgi:membrane protease subunit (stomatin/prohibitin family)
MALIDRIKCDLGNDYLIWKYASDEIKLGAQLIVNESQAAFFYKNGQLLDKFDAGRHSLITSNIPLFSKIVSLPFGGETPFSAEIWFVNLLDRRDLKWGTPQPIQIMDQTIGFPVSIRGFGSWGVRVVNPQALLLKLIGTEVYSDHQLVDNFFSSLVIQSVTIALSSFFNNPQNSYLKINTELKKFSSETLEAIESEFASYGLKVINFNIDNLSIPDNERKTIQDVFAKKMEVQQLGSANVTDSYKAIKSLDILNTAASQDGGAFASLAGAGMGLGVGLNMGKEISANVAESRQDDPVAKLRKLKMMFEEGLITESEFAEKKQSLLKDL